MKKLILITNDDGINAPGIKALYNAVKDLGDVLVIAPDGPRSAQSNAITVTSPIKITRISQNDNITVWTCSGTPTDCVKIGIRKIAPRRPDVVISGINHGRNTSISVIYSGTMGAALEACVDDIPALGFSHYREDHTADLAQAARIAHDFTAKVLAKGLPRYTCLNVNIPDTHDIKGTRICRQAMGSWDETFEPTDNDNSSSFMLGGVYVGHETEAEDTDEYALTHGYVSVVPVTLDMTAYNFLNDLKSYIE